MGGPWTVNGLISKEPSDHQRQMVGRKWLRYRMLRLLYLYRAETPVVEKLPGSRLEAAEKPARNSCARKCVNL